MRDYHSPEFKIVSSFKFYIPCKPCDKKKKNKKTLEKFAFI